MITKLDNKYLILTWDDIAKYLNNSEKRSLAMAIDKVEISRFREGKKQKAYTVVSETMDIYEVVTKGVLDEINGVELPSKIQMPNNVIQNQTGSGDKVAGDKVVIKKKSAPKKKASPNKSVFKD